MRMAVISDVHGNLPALQAVEEDFRRRNVDLVVNLGDMLSGPLFVRETAQHIMAQKHWIHIAGNHERQILDPSRRVASDAFAFERLDADALRWIGQLQDTFVLQDSVYLCHGSPRQQVEYLLETVESDGHVRLANSQELMQRLNGLEHEIVLCGHSHSARAMRSPGGALLVNPGSVGLPAFADDHYRPHRMEAGSPDARYAIVERGPIGWSASLISVPYAWQNVAALARQNGRPDWAHALATGYAPLLDHD